MTPKPWYRRSLVLGILIGLLQMGGVLVVLIPTGGGSWDPFTAALKVEVAAIFISIVALLKTQMDHPSIALADANEQVLERMADQQRKIDTLRGLAR